MNTVKYMHRSSQGSYWIDCEIITKRNFNFETDAYLLDVFFAKAGKYDSKNHPMTNRVGYEIRFYDDVIGEFEVRWVPPEDLKFPNYTDLIV